MSLVSTYVKLSDQKWYDDPVLSDTLDGNGNWFICYDDEDPIELIVTDNFWENNSHMVDLLSTLFDIGFKFKGDIKNYKNWRWSKSGRCYPNHNRESNFNFKPSHSIFIDSYKNPEIQGRCLVRFDKIFNKQPTGQGVYYDHDRNKR